MFYGPLVETERMRSPSIREHDVLETVALHGVPKLLVSSCNPNDFDCEEAPKESVSWNGQGTLRNSGHLVLLTFGSAS